MIKKYIQYYKENKFLFNNKIFFICIFFIISILLFINLLIKDDKPNNIDYSTENFKTESNLSISQEDYAERKKRMLEAIKRSNEENQVYRELEKEKQNQEKIDNINFLNNHPKIKKIKIPLRKNNSKPSYDLSETKNYFNNYINEKTR